MNEKVEEGRVRDRQRLPDRALARRRGRARLLGWACALAGLVALAPIARAQPRGDLADDTFNIDLVTGPIVGSGRIVGLGGAYTALANGIDGAAWSPAAYTARTAWETDFFEWDVTADYAPGAFKNTDFDNNGQTGFTYSNFVFATFGLRFDFNGLGFGGLARLQDYNIGDGADLTLWTVNYGAAYSLLEGQLVLGLGLRTALLRISSERDNPVLDFGGSALVDFSGTGPEAGVLFAFEGTPYRIGASARLPVEATQNADTRVVAGLALPQHLVLPAEVQVGFAFQLGERPLNRRFISPTRIEDDLRRAMLARRYERQRSQVEKELAAQPSTGRAAAAARDPMLRSEPQDPDFWQRELQLQQLEEAQVERDVDAEVMRREAEVHAFSRRFLLISTEAIFTGTTADGVGLESFLRQEAEASGERVTVGFRLGVEGEPLANLLKVRAGTYLEPSRFEGVPYRGHGTFGADVKLFGWDIFHLVSPFVLRFGFSVDLAPRYSNIGFGIGTWN